MKKYTTFLIIVFLLLQNYAHTQSEDNSPTNSKVEKLYQTNSYGAALEKYHANKSNAQTPTQVLADSYRLTGDSQSAEHWYGILVNEGEGEPLNKLYYAQALQSNGKYNAAKKWFLDYSQSIGNSENVGEQLAAYCDVAAVLVADEAVVVKNMETLNSEQLDFSPMFYKNGLMFTSTRNEENKMSIRKDLWTNDNFMDLYFARVRADDLTAGLEKIFKNSNGKFHDGTATFSPDQNTMYFAGSNIKKGRRKKDGKGMTRLKIYQAQNTTEGWRNVNPLPFNDDEFDTCHPALSPSGNVLFFSSNRPDGFGGMDLYKSEKTAEGWSEPENLGATINTEGNEIFPFVHDDGTLYFASNGLSGIGGLDLFSTLKIEDENLKSTWSIPQNLGKPINTAKDDFGLIVDISGTKGYFSSNRKGGIGMDDIYSFSSKKGIQNTGKSIAEKTMMTTQFCIQDKQNQTALEGVEITFVSNNKNEALPFATLQDGFLLELKPIDSQGEKYSMNLIKNNNSNTLSLDNQLISNENGLFDASFFPNEKYKIRFEKVGYETLEMDFFYPEFLNNQQSCFVMQKLNCNKFEGQVLNQNYNKGLSNSKITVLNKCTGEVEKYTTDDNGNFAFCMSCECEYEILASKPYFSVDLKLAKNPGCKPTLAMQFFLKNRGEGLDQLTASNSSDNNINTNYTSSGFSPNGTAINSHRNSFKSNSSNRSNSYEGSQTDFYNNINTNSISVGAVIELKNIFYDFDAHYIREDAETELDKVVELLQQFPSMRIELGSHTDARGEQKYNQKLSQKRADAAVRYIVKNGIDRRRITGVGYGENFLKNDCRDGFDCPEEAHQRNRRTEIKVLALEEAELNVRYIDNAPAVIDSPSGRM